MRAYLLAAIATLALTTAPAVHAAELPDTGQATCYNATTTGTAGADELDTGGFPRQDCRYGRDAAQAKGVLYKIGDGAAGFDYTKIANNGTDLAASAALGTGATDWACTRDNLTGLVWEVKATAGLRNKDHYYRWYNSDSSTNGGDAGTANGGSCSDGTGCDTEKFVADVNTAQLCGYTDWRLPSKRELATLTHNGAGSEPFIDTTYFPNTRSSNYWSATTHAEYTNQAWLVDFYDGVVNNDWKMFAKNVLLVRGAQF